jgi:hypothetical protein
MSTQDPFHLPNVVRRAIELRREHTGEGGLAWHRLTEAQKVPWILKANQELGGVAPEVEDARVTAVRKLAQGFADTPTLGVGTDMVELFEASTKRWIGNLFLEILEHTQS